MSNPTYKNFELFLADEGDQCDSCGLDMPENHAFWGNENARVRYRFCSTACVDAGVTDKSRKARFIRAVLGEVKP